MHPRLFTLPGGLIIWTYGFCMMVGFLSAVWLAMRRSQRVKANPDTVLDISFLALLFGVGGARLFFVVHYWSDFANASNRFLAIIDIRRGGLEFLGGFLGAMAAVLLYLIVKKQSIRLYLDIMAPSLMWGLAFGRLGCFFNGCCFGGLCVVAGTDQPAYPWAVQFPYHSPAQIDQWKDRQVTIPAELIVSAKRALLVEPVPDSDLEMSVEQRDGPRRAYEDLLKTYREAMAKAPDGEDTAALGAAVEKAKKVATAHEKKLGALRVAQRYPSRVEPGRSTSVSELEELAATCQSLPIHPTQLYSAIHAILLSGVLSGLFYVRRRHGVVIGVLFVAYPVARVLLEQIRADNPRETAGLTVSQSISLAMCFAGIAYLIYLYKRMPERSPRADAAAPPDDAARST